MIDDGKLSLFRGVFMAMVIWMLARGVEGGRSSWNTPAPTTTTTRTWSDEGNLLCDDDTLTTIKGEWTADSSECTMENTDSRCGNVVWIGSDDGMTPDGDYDCDCFSMTVVLEIADDGDNAGVMFRTGECPETNNAGPTYYVGLDPGSDEVVFAELDGDYNELYSAEIDGNGICYGKTYKLTISGCGDTYSVYLDGELVLEDVTAAAFSRGSIGLRTYSAPSTYHYLSFECISTHEPTGQPTSVPTTDAVFTRCDSKGDFDDAQDCCEKMGLELATIHSEADNDAAKEECNGSCWIGLHSIDRDAFDFVWLNGEDWIYENWYPTQPDNNRNEEDCVYMKSSGSWFDQECNQKKRALCRNRRATLEPTKEPSADPTEKPSPSPTKYPTPAPTNWPSPSPTERPTDGPTADPTKKPTKWPTSKPTMEPTPAPSDNPTEDPTASPTTPSPTHPGEMMCGDEATGDYNGETVNVEVQATHDCDMTLDLCGSDFEIGSITAFDSEGNQLVDTNDAACILTVTDLEYGEDYFFYIDGADGVETGTFDVQISCETDSPTGSPTRDPTERPTMSPSADPSQSPSEEPSPNPTPGPTKDPSPGPTKWPTPAPTNWPSPSPTERPTSHPSDGPTLHPTVQPSEDPTADPSAQPSSDPTPAPSDNPTDSPSANPTEDPSASPTTPSPTHPGELECGDEVTGDYNGETVQLEVRAPYDCDMTLDLCGSDFGIGSITAYDSDGNELTDSNDALCILTVTDLDHGGDYLFIFEGADGVESGTFDLEISCASDSPTRSPTEDPTDRPTQSPSSDPTQSPSEEPSPNPTPGPTPNPSPGPTANPTEDPTASPTTPSPTHPGDLECGDEISGHYSGETMNVEATAPYDGEITINICESDFEVVSITAYDSDGNLLTDTDPASCILTVTVEEGEDYFFYIDGADGASGGFDLTIECSSDSPTHSPSADPTKKPTVSPSANPTAKPTQWPTSKPTKEPTSKPTKWPTPAPVPCPTDNPTEKPTMWPTPSPTVATTASPTTATPTTPEPTQEPTSYPTYPKCETDDAMNIAFVMDESGSVDSGEWDIITEFVDRIATYDVAGPSYVSLFEYASLPVFQQFLDWTPVETGETAISNALSRNPYTNTGRTFTWDAVNRVLDEFWSYRKNCTDGCETRHDILFLLTDGEPSDDVCPDMIERANTTTVDIVIIGIGTYAESNDNWMTQIDCLDIADDKEDIYYVTEFEVGDFNAIEGVIRNYTCSGEYPASDGDRGGAPWVYDDGSTSLGPVPTTDGSGTGVQDDTPSPVASSVVVPDGGASMTFSQWISEGSHFFKVPAEISTSALVMIALAVFVAVTACRWYRRWQQKSYKRVVFQDAGSDSETDVEAAQPMNL